MTKGFGYSIMNTAREYKQTERIGCCFHLAVQGNSDHP